MPRVRATCRACRHWQVSADGGVHLMEVNVNPAFGAFLARTEARLIRPMYEDLLRLCVLPTAGGPLVPPPRPGRFRLVRPAGGLAAALSAGAEDMAAADLKAHLAYVTFKKSSRKKYERKAGATQQRDTRV